MARIHRNIFYRYIKLAGCNGTGKSMSLNPMFSTEGTSHTFSMVGRGKVTTIPEVLFKMIYLTILLIFRSGIKTSTRALC